MRSLLLNPTTTLEEDLNSKFLIYSQKNLPYYCFMGAIIWKVFCYTAITACM